MKFNGIGVSPGIVSGKAYVFAGERFSIPRIRIDSSRVEEEIIRFKEAIARTRGEIKELQKKVASEIGEEPARILDAHVLVLEDTLLIEKTVERVRRGKLNIDYVFSGVLEELAGALSKSSDSYLRGRASDVRDVGRRVLKNLLGKEEKALEALDEEVIVVAYDLSPADTAGMHKEKVIGFVTDVGSRTSHTAIMARSLEIPAVVGLEDLSHRVVSGDTLIVDGTGGVVIVNPKRETFKSYDQQRIRFEARGSELRELSKFPAQTVDGHVVRLMANIELKDELRSVLAHGADGIGLYRTEFFYLNRQDLPGEDEQYEAYRYIAKRIAPHPLVIRTVDLGGDKFVSRLEIARELNPFMGCRGIRFCLEQPELFKTQLRAILRASTEGKLRVMFPLVSTVTELRKAKELLEQAKKGLRKKGKSFDENLEIGVMIETPSAAMIADILAGEVNFFSIGTNDLIQYSLAIDRINEKVAYLYRPSHPGVLRLIKRVVDAGHSKGIRIDMCGEMAGEAQFAIVLLGLGLDGFSMSPVAIPTIKRIIRSVTLRDARELASDVLKLSTADEVEKVLSKANMGGRL